MSLHPAFRALAAALVLSWMGVALSACNDDAGWHATDVTGISPDLQFAMTRAEDGRHVTAADYSGKVTLLYFGYTFCPDICPTTLADVAQILKGLGGEASKVRVLFVTVDPGRDTPKVLDQYTDAFAPQVDGLTGTPDQLAALARRYRIAYAVTPNDDPSRYEVSHSPAVYVFGKQGRARLVIGNLGVGKPDLKGIGADLHRLIGESAGPGWLGWLQGVV